MGLPMNAKQIARERRIEVDVDDGDLPRAVLEASGDAIMVVDDDGRILVANSATSRLFRYSPRELIDLPLTTLVPSQQGAPALARTKDGQRFAVELSQQTGVMNGRGILVVSVVDVRARTQAERIRKTLTNQALLRTDIGMALAKGRTPPQMLQHCAEALVRHTGAAYARIWTLDDEGAMLELQASAGQYPRVEGPHRRVPVGHLTIGFIAQQRTPVVTNAVVGDPRVSDRAWAEREGMIGFAAHPLVVDDRVVGVMALFSRHVLSDDILEYLGTVADAIAQGLGRLRAEAAADTTQAELMRVFRIVTMSELMGSIVHEIKQPLAAIVANADACGCLLSARAPDLDETRSAVQDIAREGKRASDVISTIHALLEKGQPHTAEIDVNDIIGEVIDLTRNELLKRRIVLHTRLAAAPGRLHGNRVQLQQVLLNLITNAIEAMNGVAENQRQLTIESGHDEPANVIVHVRDTGIGIEPKHLARAFDPFFTTKAEGMGMGLSICRTIVNRWGGQLRAASNSDSGMTLSFTLPVSNGQ